MDQHWHKSAREIREALRKEDQDRLRQAAQMARDCLFSWYMGGTVDSNRLEKVITALDKALE